MNAPRRLPPPCAAVQALIVAARRRAQLDDEILRRVGMRAVRSGVRTTLQLREWLHGGDCTARLSERLLALMPPDDEEPYGRFRLLAHLADGGMGRVYLAGDEADRRVVVKTLKPEYSSHELFVQRFAREAEITMRLDHANLVRGLGHGRTAKGALWMALEYVPGGDLASLVESGSELSESEALLIVLQVARALDFADRMKLIHRDIKPGNILLGFDGTAKLADFGLARFTGQDGSLHTVKGVAIGSPSFMSPEQINGANDLDIRADLYSLGCVLHFALLGRPPYMADEALEIMRMHVRDDLPDVRKTRSSLSLRTAKTVIKLMQKDRERRYESPERLVESIEKTLRGLGAEPGRALAEQTIDRSVRRPQKSQEPSSQVGIESTPAAGAELTLTSSEGEVMQTLRDEPTTNARDLDLAIVSPRLTLRSGGAYASTLALLAQPQAVMGKLRAEPVDLPLRIYPIDVFAAECKRVSRSQCRMWAEGASGTAWIEDSGSANGTLLDGRMLNPQAPVELRVDGDHILEVPRALLRLGLRGCCRKRTRREQLDRRGTGGRARTPSRELDAVLIKRLDNRPSLAYCLVLRRLTIGSSQADLMLQNWSGPDLEIAMLKGRWIWRPMGRGAVVGGAAGPGPGCEQPAGAGGQLRRFPLGWTRLLDPHAVIADKDDRSAAASAPMAIAPERIP